VGFKEARTVVVDDVFSKVSIEPFFLLIWLRCSPSISFWNDIRRLVEFLPCF